MRLSTAAGQGAAPQTSHLQEIAADGDEGFDAAAEASVLPRKGGGFAEGGGGVHHGKHGQSLLNLPLSTI